MLGLVTGLHAQPKKGNTLVKEYDVKNMKSVIIDNDYSAITVKVWDNPKVQVSAELNTGEEAGDADFDVREKNGSLRIRPQLKMINRRTGEALSATSGNSDEDRGNVNISKSSNSNSVTTTNGSTVVTTGGNNVSVTTSTSGKGYSYVTTNGTSCNINGGAITVTIPKGMALEIKNGFGNISIEDDLDVLTLNMQNGNFEAKNIRKLIAETNFANISLDNIETAEMDMNSGNFTAASIGEWKLSTKFSTISADKVSDLNLEESQSDNIDIEDAGTVKGEFQFSNIKIYKLRTSLDLTTNSGSIKVKRFEGSAEFVKLEGTYTDVDLSIKSVQSYDITARTIFSTLRVPGKLIESSNEPDTYTVSVGSGKKLKIDIDCNSCTINLK